MAKEILNAILLAGMFILLFLIAEILYHKFRIKAENTRKIVHVGTGLITMLFPLILQSGWVVFVLCACFGLSLVLSLRLHLLPSINAIARPSYGSLLYPIAVYTCFLVYKYFHNNLLFFYLPVLTMALCDPVAALVGRRWPYGRFQLKNGAKTITGSIAFFICSVMLTMALHYFFSEEIFKPAHVFLIALIIAACATATEALSTKGVDNITIPICVVMALILLHV